MPLYEYQCKKCGRKMEKIRKFSDPPLTVCENCGGELEQLLSSPAIQFKGAGWYVTDYAKKSSGTSGTSSDAAPSSASEKSSESKSETKSEAKESAKPSEPAKATTSKD